MDALFRTVANWINRRSEDRVNTVVSMALTAIGSLAAIVEKSRIIPRHPTQSETESLKSSVLRVASTWHHTEPSSVHPKPFVYVVSRHSAGQGIIRAALDYHSYRLADRSQHYYDDVYTQVDKMEKRLEVRPKSSLFHASDLISILSILPVFQVACDTNGIH